MSKPETDIPPPQQTKGEPIADDSNKKPQGCNLPVRLSARETFRIDYEGVVNDDRDKLALNAVRKKMTRVRERFTALAADYCHEGNKQCPGTQQCLPRLSDLTLGYTRESPDERGFSLIIDISANVACECAAPA